MKHIISFSSQQDQQQAVGALKALKIPFVTGIVDVAEHVVTAPKKQKPYKLREYPVIIHATTDAKGQEILSVLSEGFGAPESSMRVVGSFVMKNGRISFTVRYGVRGNCPADIRGKIKRLLQGVNTTASIIIGEPKTLMYSA